MPKKKIILIVSLIIILFVGIKISSCFFQKTSLSEIGSYIPEHNAMCIYASKEKVYMGTTSGLEIIDISNPSLPKNLGSYKDDSRIKDVYVSEKYAYIASEDTGFRIIDISNPSSPIEIGVYNPKCNCSVDKMAFQKNLIYLLVYDYEKKISTLTIIDILNSSSPKEIGRYSLEKEGNDLEVKDKYVYVADGDELKIIDISNPSLLNKVGLYVLPEDLSYQRKKIGSIAINGKYAYILCNKNIKSKYESFLKVIDISNPFLPAEIGNLALNGNLSEDIEISGNYAYIANFSGGLKIVDISNPFLPIEIGSSDSSLYSTDDITILEECAYIIDENKLKIIDISNLYSN